MELLLIQGLGYVKSAAEVGAMNIFRKAGICIKKYMIQTLGNWMLQSCGKVMVHMESNW